MTTTMMKPERKKSKKVKHPYLTSITRKSDSTDKREVDAVRILLASSP